MKPSQLKATAFHEAGHAVRSVAAASRARRRKGVTIVPDIAARNVGSVASNRIIGE
jgi:hypothetical protein